MISKKHVFKASVILLASGSLLGACAKSATHSAAQKTPAAATSSAKAKSASDLVKTTPATPDTSVEGGSSNESESVSAETAVTSTASSTENMSIEEASAFVFGGRIEKAPDQSATFVEAKILTLSDIPLAKLDDATAKELSPDNLRRAQAAIDRENDQRLVKAQAAADQAADDKYSEDDRQANLANEKEQARIDYIDSTRKHAKSARYVSIPRDTFFVSADDVIDLYKGLGLYKDLYNQGTHDVTGAKYESAIGRKAVAFLTHQPKGSQKFYSAGYTTIVDLEQRAANETGFIHAMGKLWDGIRPWNKQHRLEDDAEVAQIGAINLAYGNHLARVAFVHRSLQEFARTQSGDSLRLEGVRTFQFVNFLKDALKAHQSGVNLKKTYGDEAFGK